MAQCYSMSCQDSEVIQLHIPLVRRLTSSRTMLSEDLELTAEAEPEAAWWDEFDVDETGGRSPILSTMSEADPVHFAIHSQPLLSPTNSRRRRLSTSMSYRFDLSRRGSEASIISDEDDFEVSESHQVSPYTSEDGPRVSTGLSFGFKALSRRTSVSEDGRSFEVNELSGRPPVFNSPSSEEREVSGEASEFLVDLAWSGAMEPVFSDDSEAMQDKPSDASSEFDVDMVGTGSMGMEPMFSRESYGMRLRPPARKHRISRKLSADVPGALSSMPEERPVDGR